MVFATGSVTWVWIGLGVYGFETLCLVAVCAHVSYWTYKKIKEMKSEHGHRRQTIPYQETAIMTTRVSNWLCVFFFLLHGLAATMTKVSSLFQNTFHSDTCTAMSKVGAVSYALAKAFMYIVMGVRLHLAYSTSVYAYKPWAVLTAIIYPALVGFATVIIIIIWGDVANDPIRKTNILGSNVTVYSCNSAFPQWGIAWVAGNDIVLTFLFVFLFIRPLVKIIVAFEQQSSGPPGSARTNTSRHSIRERDNLPSTPASPTPDTSRDRDISMGDDSFHATQEKHGSLRKQRSSSHQFRRQMSRKRLRTYSTMQKIKEDKRKMEWLELSIKYAILGLTGALTSTGVLIVIGITDSAVWSACDAVVSAIALSMMGSVYDDWYSKVCCGCVALCHFVTCLDDKKDAHDKEIKMHEEHKASQRAKHQPNYPRTKSSSSRDSTLLSPAAGSSKLVDRSKEDDLIDAIPSTSHDKSAERPVLASTGSTMASIPEKKMVPNDSMAIDIELGSASQIIGSSEAAGSETPAITKATSVDDIDDEDPGSLTDKDDDDARLEKDGSSHL